jgi:hypothetical protein
MMARSYKTLKATHTEGDGSCPLLTFLYSDDKVELIIWGRYEIRRLPPGAKHSLNAWKSGKITPEMIKERFGLGPFKR